ncbi:hypothetical protein Hypma_005757 [Hypsizygus marmoreus]|uniref:Uncharacterized protein n=1 Tax=Hypsizygus marmoreus TaxID=39966 RepID=A0A369K867_HYPMA|nr:hypothetical protein Hypma_005757 [Hypsizygus marmoreus]
MTARWYDFSAEDTENPFTESEQPSPTVALEFKEISAIHTAFNSASVCVLAREDLSAADYSSQEESPHEDDKASCLTSAQGDITVSEFLAIDNKHSSESSSESATSPLYADMLFCTHPIPSLGVIFAVVPFSQSSRSQMKITSLLFSPAWDRYVSSMLCQRYIWGIDCLAVGIMLSSIGTIVGVVLC